MFFHDRRKPFACLCFYMIINIHFLCIRFRKFLLISDEIRIIIDTHHILSESDRIFIRSFRCVFSFHFCIVDKNKHTFV